MKKLGKLKLKNVATKLTKEEMKNVTGGSYVCYRVDGNSMHRFEPYSLQMGVAWCDFWLAAGQPCSCYTGSGYGYIYV